MKFQQHIGLDIGQNMIKLVQLSPDKDKFRLNAIGIAPCPISENTPEGDIKTSEAIKKLIAETKANGKAVVLSLPESQVYTRVVEMPFLEEPELTSTIKWQAEQYIPVPVADVILKHQVLGLPESNVPGAKMTVLLVAAPTNLVDRYNAIAARANLSVIAVETEIFAAARSLVAMDDFSSVSCIVNIGSETTTLAVLKKGDLMMTQAVPIGGAAMDRVLASQLKLDIPQAEEYKKTYGLLENKLDGRVSQVIKPSIDQILGEVKKIVAYVSTRNGSDPIKRIVLCGGNALIPGLLSYFTAGLGFEVQFGNPYSRVNLTENQQKVVLDAGPVFACAVGLAMKSV